MKTKVTFKIKPLTDTQLKAMQNVMANSLVNAKERKYKITVWNDEEQDYKTGYYYIPDITYVVDFIEGNTIRYQEFEMNIIEY